MTLQSHDRFDEFAVFDPESGTLVIHSKKEEPELWSKETNGWYGNVNAAPAVLFHLANKLFFLYGCEKVPIEDSIHAEIRGSETQRKFLLIRNDAELASISYEVPRSSIATELDLTQTHAEDFDFLLFVRNILETPRRRKLAQGLRTA